MSIEAEDQETFGFIMKELGTGSVSMAPGIAGSMMMFPPIPVARSEAFMVPAGEISANVTLDDHTEAVERYIHQGPGREPEAAELPARPEDTGTCAHVPLRELAWARSGDKGDTCNIGIVARKPEFLPFIAAALSEETLERHYGFMLRDDSSIERHYLPGSNALNILLGGGARRRLYGQSAVRSIRKERSAGCAGHPDCRSRIHAGRVIAP